MIRIVGGVLGSVLGASAMSVYQYKDTTLDFENYIRHVATPVGLLGAVAGGFVGAFPDLALDFLAAT